MIRRPGHNRRIFSVLVFAFLSPVFGQWSAAQTTPKNVPELGQSSLPLPIPPPPEIPASIIQPPGASDDDNDNDLNHINVVGPAIAESAEKWADEREKSAEFLLEMRTEILDRVDLMDSRFGEEKTNEMIRGGHLSVNRPDLGQMKITLIKQTSEDGLVRSVRVPYFIEKESGRAVLIYNKDEIDPNSDAIRKFIATMHIRGNGRKGRDVVLMELNIQDGNLSQTVNSPKPRGLKDWRRWTDDHVAYYAMHPDQDDVVVGVASGIAQGGLNYLMSAVKTNLDNGTLSLHSGAAFLHSLSTFQALPAHLDWTPTVLAVGFGATLGVFNRSYQKFAYDASLTRSQQAVRQMPATLLFSSMMMLHTGHVGSEHFFSISFLSTNVAQFYLNKYFISNPWNLSLNLRTKLQENSGRVRLAIMGRSLALRKDSVERAGLYLIPFVFKNTDFFLRSWENFNIHIGPISQPVLPLAALTGAGLASLNHLWYLYRLKNRPISEHWSAIRSQEIEEKYNEAMMPWRGVAVFAAYPDLLPYLGRYIVNRTAASLEQKRDAVVNAATTLGHKLSDAKENVKESYKVSYEQTQSVPKALKLTCQAAMKSLLRQRRAPAQVEEPLEADVAAD